jgi:hypothetical protein
MSTIPSNATVINHEYYYYSNGSYERKKTNYIEENSQVAKVENTTRSIHGPIPREELTKFVEHIDPNSPTWEEEAKRALIDQQFVAVSINSHAEKQQNQMGMTTTSYLRSFFNWKTALVTTATVTTFFAPIIIKKYFPWLSQTFQLPAIEHNQSAVSYSANTWAKGIEAASTQANIAAQKVPTYISTPVLTYLGYKGLEALVTKVISYPATDYRTWTALNLQQYLTQVYPKLIPEEYQNDPVLKTCTDADGHLIRSPFYINNAAEINKIYEEHVLKNLLNNQKSLLGKYVAPSDGKTEIKPEEIKRNEALSDRVELRLLVLDAQRFKESANQN